MLGPDLGPGPRPVITQALKAIGIELRLASPITAVDPRGVQLASGGDAAYAVFDSDEHHALMSCQHALQFGRVSEYNAAADLFGVPLYEYRQESPNFCLDLGAWGAVVMGGWERKVRLTGELAKQAKMYINQTLIYTPDDCHLALEAANPVGPGSDELFKQIVEAAQKGSVS